MNKNIIVIAALFIMLGSASYAQIDYAPVVGVGMASLDGMDNGINLSGGLMVRADFFDRAGIQIEPLVSLMNGKNEINATDNEKITATYLMIPAYIYFGISPHIKLLAGLNFAPSLLSGESTLTSGTVSTTTKLSASPGNGMAFGLEFDIESSFKFGVRYITVKGDEAAMGSFSGATSSFLVSASYILNW